MDRLDFLPHIEIKRETLEKRYRFPKPRGGMPYVRPRDDRREHGLYLRHEASAVVSDVSKERVSAGVDPSHLLVIEFTVLDVSQIHALERLGAVVVEETREVLVDPDAHETGTEDLPVIDESVEGLSEEPSQRRFLYRTLVQFPDNATLNKLFAEFRQYETLSSKKTLLPEGMRNHLFDAISSISNVSSANRLGEGLRVKGVPEGEFWFDVDVWHTGTTQGIRWARRLLVEALGHNGGAMPGDPLETSHMLLARVKGTAKTLEALLTLEFVAWVDIPPGPSPEHAFDLAAQQPRAVRLTLPPVDGPVACVIDSGIATGHPLLRGLVVESRDIKSTENSEFDNDGHGTAVAGIVAYGDIVRCMQASQTDWRPKVWLLNAKVLRRNPDAYDPDSFDVMFPDDSVRPERQIDEAIRYFHRERNCRVFNASVGHYHRPYRGGRQAPWAELLDRLIKELDVIVVVPVGNKSCDFEPQGNTREEMRQSVLKYMMDDADRTIIDPATAALALTVGSYPRRDDPLQNQQVAVATPKGTPSIFSRRGFGIRGAVKPELSAPGGNLSAFKLAGRWKWRDKDPHLSEPSLDIRGPGRLLRGVLGSSFSAPHVTHVVARVEHMLRDSLHRTPSVNLVRALVVNSATVMDGVDALMGSDVARLQWLGYGIPTVESAWSTPNRVTLLAEDSLQLRSFHVFALNIPDEFIETRGNRSISIALAYDPPLRPTRRDYLARRMWFEVYRGLTSDAIYDCKRLYEKGELLDGEKLPVLSEANKLDFRPPQTRVEFSTVQVRSWRSNTGRKIDHRPSEYQDATLHILVGCREHFKHPDNAEKQRYAIVVTISHSDDSMELYENIRRRVRVAPTRARVRR